MRAFYKLRYYNYLGNKLTIPSGSTYTIATVTNIPPMGLVHKVTAKQIAGTSTAFNVDLFDYYPAAATTPSPDLGKIIDTISVTAGGTAKFSSDHGVPFVLPDKKLYIRISVSNAPSTDLDFELAVVLATND